MKFALMSCFVILALQLLGQHNQLPQHSFFKDQIFANKLEKPYNGGSFFPITENEYNLIPLILDSTKQYYDFTQTLFKKHLIELKGQDYYLTISPMFDFSRGKDDQDTNNRSLFQNTRGFHVEGDLFNNFSFSTSFYENQGRYTEYESDYYSSLGELYPKPDSSYQTQNAVIPGGGRTKPFKGDGFDYAYAIGVMTFMPVKQLTLSAGNNMHFVGDGHRSLLLSDNSYGAPYLRADWKITPKWRFSYMRSRLLNLLRRPASGSVESYYESKGYSVNYLTYLPSEFIHISLFEGSVWNRGDSITSQPSHPLFYNPIPVLSGVLLDDPHEISSLLGINFGAQIAQSHRVYGQLAVNNFQFDKMAFQLGYRGYNFFGLNDFMIQLEYNNVPDKFYVSENPRLNYAQFNLPLAHVKGNGFQEFILRSNYEYKRIYLDVSAVFYFLEEYSSISLLPSHSVSITAIPASHSIQNTTIEFGYRFNRKVNLTLFGAATLRSTSEKTITGTRLFTIGLRTSILNHYNDF